MELKHVLTFSDFLNEGANGVKGIRVFPPGKKNKPEGTCEAKSLAEWCNKWLQEGLTLVLSVDLDANLDDDEEFDFDDYDKYIADPKYRSVPNGTWFNKKLPKYSDEISSKKFEQEYDCIGTVSKQEPEGGKFYADKKTGYQDDWLRCVNKKGVEYLFPSSVILDVQKGCSVRDRIYSGKSYLIDGKLRGTITDYRKLEPEIVPFITETSAKSSKSGEEPRLSKIAWMKKEYEGGQISVTLQTGFKKKYTLKQWRTEGFTDLDESIENDENDEVI